jgi:hypothetical protein
VQRDSVPRNIHQQWSFVYSLQLKLSLVNSSSTHSKTNVYYFILTRVSARGVLSLVLSLEISRAPKTIRAPFRLRTKNWCWTGRWAPKIRNCPGSHLMPQNAPGFCRDKKSWVKNWLLLQSVISAVNC